MIWLLLIPVIIYLTFQNMITSDFPVLDKAASVQHHQSLSIGC